MVGRCCRRFHASTVQFSNAQMPNVALRVVKCWYKHVQVFHSGLHVLARTAVQLVAGVYSFLQEVLAFKQLLFTSTT